MNKNKIAIIISLIWLIIPCHLFAKVGKIEGESLRLSAGLNFGSYESDWMKREQTRYLLNGTLHPDWDPNSASGIQLKGDYFFKTNSNKLDYLFIGLDIESIASIQSSYAINSSNFNSIGIEPSMGITSLNFGAVFFNEDSFRIKPKLIMSRVSQEIMTESVGIGNNINLQYSGLNFANSQFNSSTNTSLLGAVFEYDVNEKLTVYTDIQIYNPFFPMGAGTYETSGAGLSIGRFSSSSLSGAGVGLGLVGASGSYEIIHANRVELGGAYNIDNNLKFFISLANSSFHTKFKNQTAYALSFTQVNTISSLGLDVIGERIGGAIIDSEIKRISFFQVHLGISKDIRF